MGTASQALESGDPNEKKALDELLAKKFNRTNPRSKKRQQKATKIRAPERAALDQLFGKIINDVLFGNGADPETKRRVEQAVRGPIMDQIVRPYLDWKNGGGKWPFRKEPTKRGNRK